MTRQAENATSTLAKNIGVLTLAVMNVATVVSLGGLPSEAKYGLTAVFYYVFAAVFFLTPLGLVAAELATGWPQRGGVFRWVSEAFGARWGFLAIFVLWIQTTIWFPSCLIYGGSALAFAGPSLNWDEALAANKHYIAIVVLLLYWTATVCALRGVATVSVVARWSGLVGTIAPAALLIVFGIIYYFSGRPMYVELDWKDLIPDFSNFDNLVLAAGVFLCYAGLEMNAIHVEDIRNAQRAYPLAILISALAIVAIYTLGTLTIALIIQPGQIDLTQSLLVTYRDFFQLFDLPWLSPLIAVALTVGAFGAVAIWIAGPSTALVEIGRAGFLPPFFHPMNSHGAPYRIIFTQGLIVSLLSALFILLPSVEATFQILNQLCTILFLTMYMLIFAAGIRLRYSQPDVRRAYMAPGGLVGMWIFGGAGFTASLIAFALSFMPPSQIFIGSPALYSSILIACFTLAVAIPLVIFAQRKPEWRVTSASDFEPLSDRSPHLENEKIQERKTHDRS